MTKEIGFAKDLIPLVLSGKKNITWRLFDDKDLNVGDKVVLVEQFNREPFAKAKLTKVKNTTFGEMTETDKDGHEVFKDDQEMLETYSGYYNKEVTYDTSLKVIWFELIS